MSARGTLFDRDHEAALLDQLVHRAAEGDAVLVLLEGPAGIGKSSLLAEAREQARAAGFRVLTARGSEVERESPYGVVRQLFETPLHDPELRGRWLEGSAGVAERVFAPPEDDEETPGLFGILHGLFWLTVNAAADGPLALVIDDLHWCDPASLRFLAYLERRLEGLGVLVATAARVEGGADPESQLLIDIVDDDAATSIRLGALSETGAAEMVRAGLADDAENAFCMACHRATGGNPLLLQKLVTTLRDENVRPDAENASAIREFGPRAVSRTVLLRLSRLPPDAVAVARAIAVLGDGASPPATAALAGLDEDKVADATRTLVAAEILRADAPLGFVHALVRDAVYLDLSVSEREPRHHRAARELAALGAAPDVVAGQSGNGDDPLTYPLTLGPAPQHDGTRCGLRWTSNVTSPGSSSRRDTARDNRSHTADIRRRRPLLHRRKRLCDLRIRPWRSPAVPRGNPSARRCANAGGHPRCRGSVTHEGARRGRPG